jgi:hypothetical protein
VERHVDAGGDAGGGEVLAVFDPAAADRVSAELLQLLEVEPVAGRLAALEQAGGAEDERAGADRGRPAGAAVDVAQPGDGLLVVEQRAVAFAAGDEDDVRFRAFGEVVVDGDAEAAGVGADLAALLADEEHLPVGNRAEHLVGADRVEGG